MNEPLIIVGASARAAAQSALRAGLGPVYCGDQFADEDLARCAAATRIVPYPAGLADFMQAAPQAPWIFVGGLENEPALVDRLAGLRTVLGNRGAVLRRIRDPFSLGDALTRAGFKFPTLRRRPDGLPVDGSWLVKTTRSCGGHGVAVWMGQTLALGGARPRPARRYWQRRLDGPSLGAVFVAAGARGATLLGVTKQLDEASWTRTKPFGYAGSLGPAPLDDASLAELVRLGDLLAGEFDLVGLVGVDLIMTPDRLNVLEVNPRYTASVEVLEWATGMQSLRHHVEACREGRLPSPAEWAGNVSRRVCGKAILYAQRRVVVRDDLTQFGLTQRLADGWPTVADVPSGGAVIEPGRPALTVLAAGPALGAVEAALRQRVCRLREMLGDCAIDP